MVKVNEKIYQFKSTMKEVCALQNLVANDKTSSVYTPYKMTIMINVSTFVRINLMNEKTMYFMF